MRDAIIAEALKLRRHRATWLMVWIVPIVTALVVAGVLIYGAVAGPDAEKAKPAADWVRSSTTLWRFPTSQPGRLLLAGYVGLAFAGEYGWNTWKLVIPARVRWQLIAAKWLVVAGFAMAAYTAAAAIGLAGDWLASLQSEPIPAGVTLAAVADAHARAFGHALMPVAFTVASAAMFAILTRSVLAAIVLSIALVIIEGMLPLIAMYGSARLPGLTEALLRTLPFYHLGNLTAWAKGAGLMLPLAPGRVLATGWATSLAVAAGWIAAAGAVTQLRFGRQDVN